jgi:hypothetical protein
MSNSEISIRYSTFVRRCLTFAIVKILRIILAIATVSLSGCSWFGGGKQKSSARMYDGDESPVIKMFEESPGTPLNN